MNFFSNLYNSDYFEILIFVAIAVLALIFLIIVILGNKKNNKGDKKKVVNQEVEQQTANIVSQPLQQQPAPIVNNQQVMNQTPSLTEIPNNPVMNDQSAISSFVQQPIMPAGIQAFETPVQSIPEPINQVGVQNFETPMQNIPEPELTSNDIAEPKLDDMTRPIFNEPIKVEPPIVEPTIQPVPEKIGTIQESDLPRLSQNEIPVVENDFPRQVNGFNNQARNNIFQNSSQQFSSVFVNGGQNSNSDVIPNEEMPSRVDQHQQHVNNSEIVNESYNINKQSESQPFDFDRKGF